jgi:hypothetical protein
MLKCYDSTAPNWHQTISEQHYQISARKPRQLWSGGMLVTLIRPHMAPPRHGRYMVDIGEPPFQVSYRVIQKYVEENIHVLYY